MREPLYGMKTKRRRLIPALLGMVIVWSDAARADVLWPALVVEERLFSALPIAFGLAVEILVLWLFLAMPWRRAASAGIAMNVASVSLGLALVPLSGLLWEVFPGIALFKLFNIGTFNPGTWVATFVLACGVNALVEAGVLRWAFGVAFSKRLLVILAVANAASVGIAYGSLWLRPAAY